MARGDFFVSFGSDLPEFLANTQQQVQALDTAIKGIGGAFADLAKVDTKDIAKLEKIASALQGGGSINIDTRGLDDSIKKLERTLATQLKDLSSGITGDVKGPDMSGVSEAFKNIKPGELKRQAGFLARHVDKLREQTSEVRASFSLARNEATKTQRHSRAIATALDELNDSLLNAASILNQAKLEPPDAEALSTAASQARATAAASGAQESPAHADEAKAAEESAKASRRKAKVTEEAANKITEDTRALEQLFRARRDELVAKREISRYADREKKGQAQTRKQVDDYNAALAKLAKAQERKAEALDQVSKEQLAQFKKVDQGEKSTARLDALKRSALELEAARKAEAQASRNAAAATEKAATSQQAAEVKQAQAQPQVDASGATESLEVLGRIAAEAADQMQVQARSVADLVTMARQDPNWLMTQVPDVAPFIEELRERIRAGTVDPVILEHGEERIRDGFHRIYAAMLEGVEELPSLRFASEETVRSLRALAEEASRAGVKPASERTERESEAFSLGEWAQEQGLFDIPGVLGRQVEAVDASAEHTAIFTDKLIDGQHSLELFVNEVKSSGREAGTTVAQGILEAFEAYLLTRRPAGTEAESMDLLKQAGQSGAQGLSPELNQVLNDTVGMAQKSAIETAKSLKDILKGEIEIESERFTQELIAIFKNLPQFLVAAQQQGVGPAAITQEDFETLVAPFPEGLPEEMARALAAELRERHEAEGMEGLQEGIKRALEEIAALLRTSTDTRPGAAETASVVQTPSGRAQQRDYGTFGGSPESRKAVDDAVRTVAEFRERVQEAGVSLAQMIMEVQPSLDPLKDIPSIDLPKHLADTQAEFEKLRERMQAARKGGPEVGDDDKQRFRELSEGHAEFRALAREWERGKRILAELLVQYDQQKDIVQGLSGSEQTYAAARKASLDAENQVIAAAREEAMARREVIEAGEEALRRLSADPAFRDAGRRLPSLDARRDFPGTEDTGDFAKEVDAFNKKRTEWLQSIVEAIDVEDPAKQSEAFKQVDTNLRKLYGELDALYQRRNASVKDELESQRANLEGMRARNENADAVAVLEREVAALEERYAEIKQQQARAAKQRELATQVPLDATLAVGVERQRFKQQADTVRAGEETEGALGGIAEGIYAKGAELLAALEEAARAAESQSGLADAYLRAQQEADRVLPDLRDRFADLRDVIPALEGELSRMPKDAEERPAVEGELARLKEQASSLGSQIKSQVNPLERMRKELEANEAVLQRFKATFSTLFAGRGEVTQRPVGERSDLNRDLKAVISELKQTIEALPEAQREAMERREAIREDLARPEGARTLGGERSDLETELASLERDLRETLRPIDELTERRKEIEGALRQPDRREDLSGVPVTPADLEAAATKVGSMINKAIVDAIGAKFSSLDRRELEQATESSPQSGVQATLDAFQRQLEEVVVRASQNALARLTETTTSQVAGAPGAPGVDPSEISHVRDQDSISVLERIERGIRELVECCHRMAEGLGARATTATQRQGAAAPKDSGAEQLALFSETMVAAANTQSSAASTNEAAAKQKEAAAKSLITAAQQYRQGLEQGLGTVFQRAEDMILVLLEGEGGARQRSPKMAAREAAEAFGVDRGSQEFENLRVFAERAADALNEQSLATKHSSRESAELEKVEAQRASRLRQMQGLSQSQQKTLGPLLDELLRLERQLDDVKDASERARLEEELRAKRAEFRVTARGTGGQGGALAPGQEGHLLTQRLLGGQKAMNEAGEQAGVDINRGMEGGFKKAGGFSFIDRTLQTTVTFFIRSMASTLTYGLQRRIRALIGIGMETEATFIRVSSAMEATNRSAQGLRREITRISTTLGVSLAELYELSARFTGVFEDPMDVVRATEAVALLEIISQGQLKAIDGYRSLSAIQNSFFEDLEAMGKTGAEAFEFITDSTVAIQDLTGVNIEDILEGAASLGGVTEPLNFGLLETEALVAKVAQSIGQTGTAAAEQLGRIFSNVTSARFQEELLSLNLATQAQILERDFKAIFEQIAVADLDDSSIRNLADIVGGDRQFRAAMALFSQAPAIVDTYTAAADSAGRADERRADLMKELANQLKILGTNVENIVATFVRSGFLNFFEVLIRLANTVLSPINQILTSLNDMADRSMFARIIRGAVGMAAGFGAVVLVIKAMRNQLATFFRLASSQTAKQAAAGTAGAAGAAGAAPVAHRGMAGIFQRGSQGVQQVEVKNVRDFRDAMRFRHAARGRGETPLEVARRVREGELTHQRLGIGQVGVADIVTKSLPLQALEKTENRLNRMTTALVRKSAQLNAASIATAKTSANNSLLVKTQQLAGKSAYGLAWAIRGLNAAMVQGATFAVRMGRSAMALGKEFFNQIAIIGMLGAAAFALYRHMKEARDTINELVAFRFPEVPDLDEEELGIAEMRNRMEEEYERWANPPTLNIFRGDFWANAWDELTEVFRGAESVPFLIAPAQSLFPAPRETRFWTEDHEDAFIALRDWADRVKGGIAGFGQKLRDLVQGETDPEIDFERDVNRLRSGTRGALDDWRAALEEAMAIEDPHERAEALAQITPDPADIQALVDAEPTRRRAATAAIALQRLGDETDAALAEALAIARGIDDYRTLSITGVERLLGVISNIEGVPQGFRGEFAEQLDLMMEMEQIPEEFRGELAALAQAGSPEQQRALTRRLLKDALDNATKNMEHVLMQGGSEDERKAATSAMNAAMSAWASFLQSEIDDTIANAEAMAEFAQMQGRSGVAELQTAIGAAQRAARLLQPGTAEWVQAQQRVRDLRRRAAEALNFEADSADMLIAELSRDPIEAANARLRQAERDLKLAQQFGTREDVRDVQLQIARIERDLVDRADEIADARFALAQTRVRDPLQRLVAATRDVVRRFRLASSRGAGEAEMIGLQREYEEALQAETDERRNIADAAAALGMSRIRNPFAALVAATRDVVRRFRRASAAGEGAAVLFGLQQEYEEALFAQAEERRNIARAQEDLSVAQIRNPYRAAVATANVAARRMREIANVIGKDSTEYINAQQEFFQAQREIAETQRAISAAQRQFAITVAEVAQEDVQVARLRLADAQQSYREALDLYGSYSVEAEAARAAEEQARGGLRDAILQDATERIEWQLSMEQITQQQALAAYRNILATFELTEKQRRDIMLKMKQLQDSINSAMEGQFNLGDIRIPTPYEVRRSMGLDGLQDTVTQVVNDFASMFGSTVGTLSGSLSSPIGATTTMTTVNDTKIYIDGADTYEIKRILTQLLGSSAMGQTTVASSGSRRL